MTENCFPDFIFVGVGKGGTTSMYHYLHAHPQVFLPPIKETNFFITPFLAFDELREDFQHSIKIDIKKYLNSSMPYRHHAWIDQAEDYQALFKNKTADQISGEVCPSYFFEHRSFSAIAKSSRQTKIVLILRHPLARLFSQYKMNVRDGRDVANDFITEIMRDYQKTKKGYGISYNYVEGSLYAPSLRALFEQFDQKQIKILYYEQLQRDTQGLLRELAQFLEIDPKGFPEKLEVFNESGKPKNESLNKMIKQSRWIALLKDVIPTGIKKRLKRSLVDQNATWKIDQKSFDQLYPYFENDILACEKLLAKNLDAWKVLPK